MQVRPEQACQNQLMPFQPLAIVDPRPLPASADNFEADSADATRAIQNAAAEAQGSTVHSTMTRSNGNIGQVYLIGYAIPLLQSAKSFFPPRNR